METLRKFSSARDNFLVNNNFDLDLARLSYGGTHYDQVHGTLVSRGYNTMTKVHIVSKGREEGEESIYLDNLDKSSSIEIDRYLLLGCAGGFTRWK